MIRPIFRFDSREAWFPVGVEESLRATEAYIHGMPHPNEPPAARGHSLKSGNRRLDFPDDMKQRADLDPVIYHRSVRGGPLVWEQFWLWYLYNPWAVPVLGVGEHEGDWELVQYAHAGASGSRNPDKPLLVTVSQHRTAGKREAWGCQVRDGRPVIYVARGSHAMYFAPGRHDFDFCDANGPVLDDYVLRPFGKWATWPGRWGNSTQEGKSPESPGCQGIRWKAPHLFHSQARQA